MANSLQGQVTVTHVQNNGGAYGQDAQHHHRDLLQVQISVMVEFGTMSSPAMLNCLTCKQPFMSLEHYQSLQFWNLAKMVEGLCEAGW